ncbi:ATP-binding protein [Mesohalobacter halotolerans]|uniref:ATP-binding protein n=1 Tax=Mesohalobacter halotolerans TaxID=1883405 RepID=A0A4U5TRN6_9FLAO|nr:ATP-binding protein [Mesohalobacter halotolerans]TKS56930.1 ATP-binding protein [Mesohalobacter halotolerans]
MIKRALEDNIIERLERNKILYIPGPRQVGKTTLLKTIKFSLKEPILWLNGDEADVRAMLLNSTSTKLNQIIGDNKTVIIDEAQRINNIGLVLKLIKDNIESVDIIVTGSSAFELSSKINEPLTGRKIDLFLYPISFVEMERHTSRLEEKRLLDHRLIYGSYPEVITSHGHEKEVLRGLTDGYLYKDIFALDYIKKPSLIEKLLQALALQLGHEVSYNELSKLIGADNETVERYINYLEQAYVIFKLNSFSKNHRNEIKKGKKIYFYDNGIRNAIIKNFNPLSLRQDTGALWENYLIVERAKKNNYTHQWINTYFWRTFSQNEIDYIEERDGILYGFEFKWNKKKKPKMPKSFKENYPQSKFEVINRENYTDFITHNSKI